MKSILIICLLFLFIEVKANVKLIDCDSSKYNIIICLYQVNSMKKNEIYFTIQYINKNNSMAMDINYRENVIEYQFYAKDSIFLIINNIDTIKSFSYLFEDNFDGTLPYFRQIVGFKIDNIIKKSYQKKLVIKNCGINKSFNL